MPHKVNPIYFEGAEGGLEMANGIIETLVRKLPVNRLQRDFSDSTVRRTIVLPLALSFLSYQSLVTACERITIDKECIAADLNDHAEVWLETVKAFGLSHGISDMYDRLKGQTRGRILSRTDLMRLVTSLPLQAREKKELLTLCDGGHNPYPARMVNDTIRHAKRIRAL
ncbi:hypothetical protein HY411_01140 [Candidatus Gottesmanbacteria bacterium]|nr:hypothetical protein [Candidatus Gottesmanbacteria bacterium]